MQVALDKSGWKMSKWNERLLLSRWTFWLGFEGFSHWCLSEISQIFCWKFHFCLSLCGTALPATHHNSLLGWFDVTRWNKQTIIVFSIKYESYLGVNSKCHTCVCWPSHHTPNGCLSTQVKQREEWEAEKTLSTNRHEAENKSEELDMRQPACLLMPALCGFYKMIESGKTVTALRLI